MTSGTRHKTGGNAAHRESAERLPPVSGRAHEVKATIHRQSSVEAAERAEQKHKLVLRVSRKDSKHVPRPRPRTAHGPPPASGPRGCGYHWGGEILPATLKRGLLLPPSAPDACVLDSMCRWLEEAFPDAGRMLADCFRSVPLAPPVTRQSLSELDIVNMVSNPKLRHDVNFDFELHFRPNLDGHKGRLKLQNAERYWSALTAEHELYGVLFPGSGGGRGAGAVRAAAWRRMVRLCQRRIPLLFETIRDILKNLVPEQDQARVEEYLDVQMLLQQVEHGVYDLVKVSQWLSHLLKAHCAPMRDGWIDRMALTIQGGVETASSSQIVAGLRELLAILEAMKLVRLRTQRKLRMAK